MGAALLVCRLLLAGVFIAAGAAKLADLPGSRRAVADFGVPRRAARIAGTLLPVVELLIGVALVPVFSARLGAIGAVVLLTVFVAAIASAMAHGRSPDCHCFGQVHSAPTGPATLARNIVLLAMAAFVAVAGAQGAGAGATRWLTDMSPAWLVAFAAGAVIAALVAFQTWFSLQLLAQNGRSLVRLEALEAQLERLAGSPGAGSGGPGGPGGNIRLGEGMRGSGLAVGAPAPGFELPSVAGDSRSLASLLATGRRVMLIFTSAGCGPCTALMPEIANWQRRHESTLHVAVIASGDPERNRADAAAHDVREMLLDVGRDVSGAYEAEGTPMAQVIDSEGTIASPLVGGAEAITTLIGQAASPLLTVRHQVPPSNGHGSAPAPRRSAPPADTSAVGRPAPRLVLSDLDGQRIARSDAYQHRTLAIFWNPGCGFCQRMLPDLRALESDLPAGGPRLLVISSGDQGGVREQEIRSPVLLDSGGEAMRAFGAGGTPMAVLIDQGKIASHVAAGADAVLALARSAASDAAENLGAP